RRPGDARAGGPDGGRGAAVLPGHRRAARVDGHAAQGRPPGPPDLRLLRGMRRQPPRRPGRGARQGRRAQGQGGWREGAGPVIEGVLSMFRFLLATFAAAALLAGCGGPTATAPKERSYPIRGKVVAV